MFFLTFESSDIKKARGSEFFLAFESSDMNLKARGELVTSVVLQEDKAQAPPSAPHLLVYVYNYMLSIFLNLFSGLNPKPLSMIYIYNSNKWYWELLGMTMFLITFDVFDTFFGYFESLIFCLFFQFFFKFFKFFRFGIPSRCLAGSQAH